MTLAPGTRIGPYDVVALLGTGGMGEVYRATDARLGRDVAVKVLPGATEADAHTRAQVQGSGLGRTEPTTADRQNRSLRADNALTTAAHQNSSPLMSGGAPAPANVSGGPVQRQPDPAVPLRAHHDEVARLLGRGLQQLPVGTADGDEGFDFTRGAGFRVEQVLERSRASFTR